MPFRIKPDGTIEADSAEEAVELSRRLSTPPSKPPERNGGGGGRYGGGWPSFLKLIKGKPQQRKALLLIKDDKGRFDVLRKELGYESNNALTGTISGIKKNLTKAGVPPAEVLIREGTRRSGTMSYKAGPTLLATDEELKMPAG